MKKKEMKEWETFNRETWLTMYGQQLHSETDYFAFFRR